MDRIKGQNLVEFLIILVVVSIAGIFGLTMLGGNVFAMFSDSAEKQKNFDPFNVKNEVANASSPTEGGTEGDPSSEIVGIEDIDGYSVDRHADGSLSLTVGTQTVNISAEALELNDAVFTTTGASGGTLVG